MTRELQQLCFEIFLSIKEPTQFYFLFYVQYDLLAWFKSKQNRIFILKQILLLKIMNHLSKIILVMHWSPQNSERYLNQSLPVSPSSEQNLIKIFCASSVVWRFPVEEEGPLEREPVDGRLALSLHDVAADTVQVDKLRLHVAAQQP